MNLRDNTSTQSRRQAIETELSVPLPKLGSSNLDDAVASSKHCENMIGYTQIPVGIVGPLTIKSNKSPADEAGLNTKEYYIPLTTTEGALIASINRGCKAITQSGGATVTAFRIGTTRGAVFVVDGVLSGKIFSEFVYAHIPEFDNVAKQTSGHISLTDVVVKSVGTYVFVRFSFNTQDAMGMNMVTIASDAIAAYITKHTHSACLSLAGNYDIDKKPAWLNAIRGRGFETRADVVLPASVISSVLKTTAQRMYDVWLAKCMIGSALSGSMGFNAQYANVIAALFLSTGQDPAHIGEGSIGITTCNVVGDDLYISIYLPDLLIGTIGGGTGLATQKECLQILEASNSGSALSSEVLAEIAGGSVLAGEISLLASLSEGTLSRAHKRLGRGEQV